MDVSGRFDPDFAPIRTGIRCLCREIQTTPPSMPPDPRSPFLRFRPPPLYSIPSAADQAAPVSEGADATHRRKNDSRRQAHGASGPGLARAAAGRS